MEVDDRRQLTGEQKMRWEAGTCGFTLGWVMLVMMVVAILLMSVLTMSTSYTYRSLRSHNQRQAQLTAISVARAIADDFEEAADKGSIRNVLEQLMKKGDKGEVVCVGLDSDMGQVTIEYKRNGQLLILTVRAVLEYAEELVVMTLKQGLGHEDENRWEVLGYRAEKAEEDEQP